MLGARSYKCHPIQLASMRVIGRKRLDFHKVRDNLLCVFGDNEDR